jgi:chromosome partitioning protein
MNVITLASSKGGAGKTTICSALAVRAAEESRRVALLDLDPAESLASWWTRRGKTKNPKLFEIDAATEAIEMLLSEGWEWVFIDTGPAKLELAEPGIAVADLVLIPTRPSAFDIEQTAVTV